MHGQQNIKVRDHSPYDESHTRIAELSISFLARETAQQTLTVQSTMKNPPPEKAREAAL
jgi:hypothetical protein